MYLFHISHYIYEDLSVNIRQTEISLAIVDLNLNCLKICFLLFLFSCTNPCVQG